jgi:hypothetical protein
MPAFRVYFIRDKSIIAADDIDADTHTDAASAAIRGISSYPWAGKLTPNELEVWRGDSLQHSASLRPGP